MANTENAGSTADVPPVRYRVSGMDCAKDAAQIERAAQAAGVAPGDVKVSAATHIMTLTALHKPHTAQSQRKSGKSRIAGV